MVALARQNLNQFIGASIVAMLAIGAVIAFQMPQLNNLTSKSETSSAEDVKKALESERLQLELMQKLPSFGFDNMIVDWAFIKFAQYFGDETARDKSDYSLSPEYFKVIINRYPYFLDAYRFLSSSTTLYTGMPESTVALMQQGLKSLLPKFPTNLTTFGVTKEPMSYYFSETAKLPSTL